MCLSCTVSKIGLPLIYQNLKSHVILNTSFRGESIMHALLLLCINQRMKFEVLSFIDSKDMIVVKI